MFYFLFFNCSTSSWCISNRQLNSSWVTVHTLSIEGIACLTTIIGFNCDALKANACNAGEPCHYIEQDHFTTQIPKNHNNIMTCILSVDFGQRDNMVFTRWKMHSNSSHIENSEYLSRVIHESMGLAVILTPVPIISTRCNYHIFVLQ